MKKILLMLAVVISCCFAQVQAQMPVSDADKAAITQTALDYLEGWYAADAERMERALHPELAKRIVRTNPQGSRLDQMGAMTLVQHPARWRQEHAQGEAAERRNDSRYV